MLENKVVNVLMVTGVYFPEVNGATLQCMRLISLLGKKVNFSVLTTTRYKNIDKNIVNGVDIFRSYIGNRFVKFLQIIKILQVFSSKRIDIVHLHGFSSRSAFIILVSILFNKKIIIKMTSFGHDDPMSIKNKGKLFFYIFSLADVYIGVSPIFKKMYLKSDLDKYRYCQIPNGVDTNLFKPLSDKNKNRARFELGLPTDISLILVVGHFSIDKSVNHVLEAWLRLQELSSTGSGVVFIGNTNSDDFEVDQNIVDLMHTMSGVYLGKKIFFIEKTANIEKYYQSSDIYVLPSAREGLPNALLEAMSCALPVISTRLPGVTDWVVKHKDNGMTYSHGDIDILTSLLWELLRDGGLRKKIGLSARKTIETDFEILMTANKIYKVYENL